MTPNKAAPRRWRSGVQRISRFADASLRRAAWPKCAFSVGGWHPARTWNGFTPSAHLFLTLSQES